MADNEPNEVVEEEIGDRVLFQGVLSGDQPDMKPHAKLVRAALDPTKGIVTDALARRADSIRVDLKGPRARVTFSIDGINYPAKAMPKKQGHAVVQMIKVLAGLDSSQRGEPQQGGVRAELRGEAYELKVSTLPIGDGFERLSIFVRNFSEELDKPQDVGIAQELKDAIREMTGHRRGLFLVCGPRRAGVTTTTYAAVRCLDAYLHQIYTIGDTDGRELINVSAFDVQEGNDLDTTLTRCVRAEADVVLLDPIRDAEDARTVFTFHADVAMITEFAARDAASGIIQLVEWLGNPQPVAEGLSGILSQKLIRRLCPSCKQPFKPNPKLMKRLHLSREENRILYRKGQPPTQPLPKGETYEPCQHCFDVGYVGQIPIFELITMTEGMQRVVAGGGDVDAILKQVREEEMVTLRDDAIRLVGDGTTSLEELQRAFKVR